MTAPLPATAPHLPGPGSGPGPQALAQLRAWGSSATPPEVKAFYAPRLATQDRSGVTLVADQAYGPHARHRLDVYHPEGDGTDRPVLLFAHGGGFIRGDKSDRANLGWWGAQQGFVTALLNYRLAPEAMWPAGGEDVAAAWQWLRGHAARSGGDPRAIVLAGESAGAAHVAAAAFIRALQPADWQIAGAFLMSGPYDARMERLSRDALGIATPDPRNDAYFGAERADWSEASILTRIDAAPFPVWVGMTERDLPNMQVQAGALFHRLVTHHGYQPQWQVLAEHNHFSPSASLGTEDETLAAPLAAFVRTCARRAQASA
ncbi:MAG: alpha/beta hydrolase [Ramlibacter sp.]|uniref:alpha/beta hydrolase n=1 Tax=Ramlibacter sp. TaxID=1917967 RepID=UPI00261B4656|nr:alpha/beta hydrolase [Ramlibacter sp.]MDH4377053.1 alpha/beta hydrolase [Ramlibacter sp.]